MAFSGLYFSSLHEHLVNQLDCFKKWRTSAYATFTIITYHNGLLSQQKPFLRVAWMSGFLPPLRCPAVWQHLQLHSCQEGQLHCGGPASRQSLWREAATAGGSHPKVMPLPTADLAPSGSLYQFPSLVAITFPAPWCPKKNWATRKTLGWVWGVFISELRRERVTGVGLLALQITKESSEAGHQDRICLSYKLC